MFSGLGGLNCKWAALPGTFEEADKNFRSKCNIRSADSRELRVLREPPLPLIPIELWMDPRFPIDLWPRVFGFIPFQDVLLNHLYLIDKATNKLFIRRYFDKKGHSILFLVPHIDGFSISR